MVHTDASGEGLGAVLEQQQEDGKAHPIAYASWTLSKHESRYGITELEALGVVWALKHFRGYLYGSKCVVFTDHAPLRAMLKAKHPSGKLARWAGVIAELDVDIRYRPGRINTNADALSRAPIEGGEETLVPQPVLQVTNSPSGIPAPSEEVSDLQRNDPQLKPMWEYLQEGLLPEDERLARKLTLERDSFAIVDGILYFVQKSPKHRLRMAVPSTMRHPLWRRRTLAI